MSRSRMRAVLSLGLFVCVFPCLRAAGELPVPDGRRLREIAAERFPRGRVLIGATTGSWAFGKPHGLIMDREFGYVTPENDFKQAVIRRRTGAWDWSRADAWVGHVAEHGQVLRMHCPISPQCSRWAKDDRRTAAELEEELRRFMEAICRRYNGKPGFRFMDVVNETVLANGTWHGPRPGTDRWECPWEKIGRDGDANKTPSYIRMAFEIAAEHAPDLKLVYNQNAGPEHGTCWEKIKATVGYLRKRKLRVDGIGWQAHVDVGWNHCDALEKLIDWAHANDLDFHVTEAGVWLKKNASPAGLKAQAATYARILKTLLSRRKNGVVTWNTWHISDAGGWKKHRRPSLFDADYRPKPAYYAVQRVLEE